MIRVCLIGLPRQLRRRIEQSLEGRGISPSTIIADLDRTGKLQLKPKPELAISYLRDYYESVETGYPDAEIYVLPYAPIPQDVEDELCALEDLGAQIVEFEMEVEGWPYLHLKRPKINEAFLDSVAEALIKGVVDNDEPPPLPSECIRQATERNRDLHVVGNGIDLCDEIAPLRHGFVRESIKAFSELIALNGNVGNLDEFFRARGLHHAKTGGIATELEIMIDGQFVRKETHHTHLKSGDKTRPQAAARIYYQLLMHEDVFRVFLLYVGPHPDANVTRKIDIPSVSSSRDQG
ncbi:hypothetical protein N7671_19985 [Pseudomonas oleovorans]|uniref:Uncharacterized protein n=1 Tax=Ectopseudomonas oleovorans TaxID=301 RepID=A0AB35L3C8_ECTOL|nr:hypothetical protein [Pseudomonas oleovorans]MDH0569423.1 hypothetical protein [Pseudomonas oleovorans]